jgi:hypothetical protein
MAYFGNGNYVTMKAPEDYPGKLYNDRYCYEHQYVWWLNTGEILDYNRIIHHKDGNFKNNDFNNLEAIDRGKHTSRHCNKGLFGFSGAHYTYRETEKPWNRIWRCAIGFKGKITALGVYNDPLSCEIVYELVKEELY